MKSPLLAAAAIVCTTLTLSAATPWFEDGVLTIGNADGSGSFDGITSSQQYNGFDTMEYTTGASAGGYSGVNFYGSGSTGPQAILADETLFSMTVFSPSSSATGMNGLKFFVRNTTTTVGSETNISNANSSFWTLDGAEGNVANFTTDTWHTIVVDMSVNPNFEAGNSTTGAQWGFKSTGAGTLYIGQMGLIPEPSTYAAFAGILALAAAAIIRRRRS